MDGVYFLAAELMRSNYVKLQTKRKQRGELNQNDAVDKSIYFCTWLGFLRTSCEGFQKLKMRLLLQNERPKEFRELIPKSGEIGKAMKQHADLLRLIRNDIFHLREDVEAVKQFFANETLCLIWAEKLHAAFAQFFSNYRVLCEVHYVMNDRISEMQMKSACSKRRQASG